MREHRRQARDEIPVNRAAKRAFKKTKLRPLQSTGRKPGTWPRSWPKGTRRDGKPAFAAALRFVERVATSFPDTHPAKSLQRANAVMRRRAKNRVARASRKKNRR